MCYLYVLLYALDVSCWVYTPADTKHSSCIHVQSQLVTGLQMLPLYTNTNVSMLLSEYIQNDLAYVQVHSYLACMIGASLSATDVFLWLDFRKPMRAMLNGLCNRSTPCSTQMASSVQTSILMPHFQE